MSGSRVTRRQFVHTAAAAGALVPYWTTGIARALESKNDRHVIGSIGCGERWNGVLANVAQPFGDLVAVCDVDREHAEAARQKVGGKSNVYEDYRKLLDRKDIDTVIIATPDHWHTKIAIDAIRAGKDVYCEKPLTLTIDEGKQICKVMSEHKQVFQVGTQQRSSYRLAFLTAVAAVHLGRIGKLQKATAHIDHGLAGGPFQESPAPASLNWDRWLGQAPKVPYTKERCHQNFRWWFEYSGGKLTDWGAHHVDIATWAMKHGESGPISVEATSELPNIPNGYNTPKTFLIRCRYDDGVELEITSEGKNGILFEGDKGTLFVGRGRTAEGVLRGSAGEELKQKPIPIEELTRLYKGKTPLVRDGQHMANFFECVRTREQPISDVFTHHRALTTCHLANIAIRLNRKLTWDPVKQEITGDGEANAMLSREQRTPYKINS